MSGLLQVLISATMALVLTLATCNTLDVDDYEGLTYLGCLKPFFSAPVVAQVGASTSNTYIGLRSCRGCDRSKELLMLRGAQCYCLNFAMWLYLDMVDSVYCNISCMDNGDRKCGGNLGGSVYVRNDARDAFSIVDKPYFLYRGIHDDRWDGVLACSAMGCGVPVEQSPTTYYEYFPRLSPQACIVYCSSFNTTYAFLGWDGGRMGEKASYAIPTCVCSDEIKSHRDDDDNCFQPCPADKEEKSFCGNGNSVRQSTSWAVYCTTYRNGDDQCESYNTNSSGNWCSDVPTITTPVSTPSTSSVCTRTSVSSLQEPKCDRGSCQLLDCSLGNKCYHVKELSDRDVANNQTLRLWAKQYCMRYLDGDLVAIETSKEMRGLYHTFHNLEMFGTPNILTSGRYYNQQLVWDTRKSHKIHRLPLVELVSGDVENDEAFVVIGYWKENDCGVSSIWNVSSRYEAHRFMCEYRNDNQTNPTTPAAVTTTEWNPCRAGKNCPCVKTDEYNTSWVIQPCEHSQTKDCPNEAEGKARWSCSVINDECTLVPDVPDFSDCTSQEIRIINATIMDNSTDLYSVWEQLNVFTTLNKTYFGHEINVILELLGSLLNRQDTELGNLNVNRTHMIYQVNSTQMGSSILNGLITNRKQWDQVEPGERSLSALQLVNASEDLALRLSNVAERMNMSLRCDMTTGSVTLGSSFWNGVDYNIVDCDLNNHSQLNVLQRFPVKGGSMILLPNSSIPANLPHKAVGLVISNSFLEHLLPGRINSEGGVWRVINSPLISYTMHHKHRWPRHNIPEEGNFLLVFQHPVEAKNPANVRTVRRHLKAGERVSAVVGSSYCVFINYISSNSQISVIKDTWWNWDGEGCHLKQSNRTHTICMCNHLTGFANLMDFHDYTGKSLGLEVTGIVCSSSSVISLAITLAVLTVLTSIKSDRTIISQNLCGSLMLAHILTLTTLERNNFNLNAGWCAAMGILLHLSFLTSFMWMGIEGLRLCRRVLYVFNLKDWTTIYVVSGYVVPVVIVGITVATAHFTTGIVAAYCDDETCWLTGESYKWSYAGPVAFIIFTNVIFISVALYCSWNLKQNTNRSLTEKIRKSAAMSLSLSALLGLSWLSGYLLYVETDFFAYVFTITNGLQGLTILIFRCLLNDEVRTTFMEKWRRNQNNRNRYGHASETSSSRRGNAKNTNWQLSQTSSISSSVTRTSSTRVA